MMKKLLIAVACLWLGACAGLQPDYSGPDAGAIVFSTASFETPESFMFWYKPLGGPSNLGFLRSNPAISHNPGSILNRKPDFKGRETGWVTVRYLKPGDYEIYQYSLYEPGGTTFTVVSVNNTSVVVPISTVNEINAPSDFSLRFRVEPGKATYIGAFTSLYPGGVDAVLGILDRHERDLAIARRADPKLPKDITIAVPDVSGLNIPRLESAHSVWAVRLAPP